MRTRRFPRLAHGHTSLPFPSLSTLPLPLPMCPYCQLRLVPSFTRLGRLFSHSPPSLPQRSLLSPIMSVHSSPPSSPPPLLLSMSTPSPVLVLPWYRYPSRLFSLHTAPLHHLISTPPPSAAPAARPPMCASAPLSAHPSPRAFAVCATVGTTHVPSHTKPLPSHANFMRVPFPPRHVVILGPVGRKPRVRYALL